MKITTFIYHHNSIVHFKLHITRAGILNLALNDVTWYDVSSDVVIDFVALVDRYVS